MQCCGSGGDSHDCENESLWSRAHQKVAISHPTALGKHLLSLCMHLLGATTSESEGVVLKTLVMVDMV